MGPHGINRAVERLDFTDCKKGLGKNHSTIFFFFQFIIIFPENWFTLLHFSRHLMHNLIYFVLSPPYKELIPKNLVLNLIGVKIIGGYREQSGEEFGIFIKRVLPGGVAAQDGMFFLPKSPMNVFTQIMGMMDDVPFCLSGRLRAGDLILDVNNMNLGGVTNEK